MNKKNYPRKNKSFLFPFLNMVLAVLPRIYFLSFIKKIILSLFLFSSVSATAFFSSNTQNHCALPLYMHAIQSGMLEGQSGQRGSSVAAQKEAARKKAAGYSNIISRYNREIEGLNDRLGEVQERLSEAFGGGDADKAEDVVEQIKTHIENNWSKKDQDENNCDEDELSYYRNEKSYFAKLSTALAPPPFSFALLHKIAQTSLSQIIPSAVGDTAVGGGSCVGNIGRNIIDGVCCVQEQQQSSNDACRATDREPSSIRCGYSTCSSDQKKCCYSEGRGNYCCTVAEYQKNVADKAAADKAAADKAAADKAAADKAAADKAAADKAAADKAAADKAAADKAAADKAAADKAAADKAAADKAAADKAAADKAAADKAAADKAAADKAAADKAAADKAAADKAAADKAAADKAAADKAAADKAAADKAAADKAAADKAAADKAAADKAEAVREDEDSEVATECDHWKRWGECARSNGEIRTDWLCKAPRKCIHKKTPADEKNRIAALVKPKPIKQCRDDLKTIKELIEQIEQKKKERADFASKHSIAMDDLRTLEIAELEGTASATEATDCGPDCRLRKLRELKEIIDPAPSGWDILGNTVGTLGAAALGYYGIKEANELRDAQGLGAQPGYALGLAYPFIMKGLHGGGFFGGNSSSLACSPTANTMGGNVFQHALLAQQIQQAQRAHYMQQQQLMQAYYSSMPNMGGNMFPGMPTNIGAGINMSFPGMGNIFPGMPSNIGAGINFGFNQPGSCMANPTPACIMSGMFGTKNGMGGMMGAGNMQANMQYRQAMLEAYRTQMNNYMQREQATADLMSQISQLEMKIWNIRNGGGMGSSVNLNLGGGGSVNSNNNSNLGGGGNMNNTNTNTGTGGDMLDTSKMIRDF